MASAIFKRREHHQRNEEILAFAFSAIERNDPKAFAEALAKQMTVEQQNVILSTTIEHKNMEFFHQALKICDVGHKKCFALLVAAKTNNLEALRVLAPISHPTQLYYAANESITKSSISVQDDHWEKQKITSLQCFDELLRWIDPKHNQSSLLCTALLFNDTAVIHRLWDRSDLRAVANSKDTFYSLGRKNNIEYIDHLWNYAKPNHHYEAIKGATANGHLELVKQMINRIGEVDGTDALAEAVINSQEDCFDLLLPISNPQKAFNFLKSSLDSPKRRPHISFTRENFPLIEKLQQYCQGVRQQQVLNRVVEQTQNNTTHSPTSKRRM